MNIFEADYGLGPLIDIENSILDGIAKLFDRNREEPCFDGLWLNEYGEVLFGALNLSHHMNHSKGIMLRVVMGHIKTYAI